ncbi:MAG: hypothetical protein WKF84_09185 [Pyrinomonadaceae bacterium]
MLARKPGLTLVAVVSTRLWGIGANTTIFSFVRNGVLLRPLPYPEQERLAVIWETVPERGVTLAGASLLNFPDWRERNRGFAMTWTAVRSLPFADRRRRAGAA